MINKEILLIARHFDNLESDIGKKILIIFKESLHSAENLVNFHQNQSKHVIRDKCVIFGQKCVNFAQNFLATPKLSWN